LLGRGAHEVVVAIDDVLGALEVGGELEQIINITRDESENESDINDSDDAAGAVDDAHNEAPIDPCARPRRLGVGGVNYSEWGQDQRYDTTMYEVQRSRKRRRDVEEGLFNVEKI
jgi:hypothetical protein